MKFLHVMIRVKDINKSLKFYQDLFDMNLVNEMELEDSKLYFLSDEDGQTQIELTYNFDTPKNGYINGDAFGHFAFSIKNMDKFEEKMKEFGINWLVKPFILKNYDMKIAFLKDPDGNEIEIIEE